MPGRLKVSRFRTGRRRDWGWPAYTFDVPVRWRPGAYVAMLIEIDSDGTEYPPDRSTTFGTSGKALFVVRRAIPGEDASVLYKIFDEHVSRVQWNRVRQSLCGGHVVKATAAFRVQGDDAPAGWRCRW